MKLQPSNNKLRTNATTESKQFGIGDMSIVINLLTNLYSNPKQTLTQEYICNARDANRESGNKTPIDIFAPTTFKPVMRIRDYGPGLSPDRIKNVFLYYGVSTKNDTNDQTGGFGIGGKSAWAYTDSFIIHSYYNGTKYTYAAIKAENKPTLELLSKDKTNEVNGVCIEIAVANTDVRDFQRAIERTVMYWDKAEMPKLHNMSETDLNYNVIESAGNFKVLETRNYGNNCIVVDGIPYKLNWREQLPELLDNLQRDFILEVPTGAVTIAPSREELIYDKKTVEYLIDQLNTAEKSLYKTIEHRSKQCSTLLEYIKFHEEINKFTHVSFGYKNYLTEYRRGLYYQPPGKEKIFVADTVQRCERTSDDRIRKDSKDKAFRLEFIGCTLFVDTDDSPAIINRRLRTYMNKTGARTVYLLSKKTLTKFIKDLEIEGISQYEPIEIRRETGPKAGPKPLGKREIVLWGRYGNTRATIDSFAGKTVIYLPVSKRQSKRELAWQIDNFYFLSEGAIKQVSKLDNFIHFDEWYKTAELTEANKIHLYRTLIENDSTLSPLVRNGFTFTNEALKELHSIYKSKADRCEVTSLIADFKKSDEYKEVKAKFEQLSKDLMDKCEMLRFIDSHLNPKQVKTVNDYINANFK